jgi:protein TonB
VAFEALLSVRKRSPPLRRGLGYLAALLVHAVALALVMLAHHAPAPLVKAAPEEWAVRLGSVSYAPTRPRVIGPAGPPLPLEDPARRGSRRAGRRPPRMRPSPAAVTPAPAAVTTTPVAPSPLPLEPAATALPAPMPALAAEQPEPEPAVAPATGPVHAVNAIDIPEETARALRSHDSFPDLPPPLARRGASYILLLNVCVSDTGNVAAVSVLQKADAALDKVVTDAIRTWRYHPLRLDGRARPFCHKVRIVYSVP